MDPKKCSICFENPIKYTCPRCSIRTCSLSCCLEHKKTFKCNGQRDKTIFKSLNTMNDLDILSDYRFLEDINRHIEITKHDELGNKMKSFNESTYFEKLIKNKLNKLGSIQILYLPKFSTRHKQNQMWIKKQTEEIFWHIECRFFFHKNFSTWTITRLLTKETILKNLLIKYEEYSKEKNFSNIEQICVYIENFGQKRKQFGQYEKRLFNKTIIDLFQDRIFIEYPILFISLNENENEMIDNLLRKKIC